MIRKRSDRALIPRPGTRPPRARPGFRFGGYALRFALVGALKTLLDFATFNLILLLADASSTAIIAANSAGFVVAVMASFLLNARFTFRVRAARGQLPRYVAVSLFGLLVYNAALGVLLVLFDPDDSIALNLVKALALAASMTWNFIGYAWFVFLPARSCRGGESEGGPDLTVR